MVARCGYFVRDKKIYRKIVYIDWNLGFDKKAKQEYIGQLHSELGKEVGRIAEVTSASAIYPHKMLSPIFVKMRDSDMSVEEYLQILVSQTPDLFSMKGLPDYIYLSNLTDEQKEYILKYDCFTDVFNNPEIEWGNTQALALAIFKWICEVGRYDLLMDRDKFIIWFNTEIEVIDIIEGE